MMRGMVIDMNDAQLHTLDQLRAFLDGTVAVGFSVTVNLFCENHLEKQPDMDIEPNRRTAWARQGQTS